MSIILANAFSLNMIDTLNTELIVSEVPASNIQVVVTHYKNHKLINAVGHKTMHDLLMNSDILCDSGDNLYEKYFANLYVDGQRPTVKIGERDLLYVVQYEGTRLPEGATSLPEGASIKILQVRVLSD